MGMLIAALTAGLLTLFDLDRTFYIPSAGLRKLHLYAWWWGFVVTNGLLAGILCLAVGDIEALQGIPPLIRAAVVGVSYLAIIRAKFTTFDLRGKDVPFGLELFYEAAKVFFYKRINRIVKAARHIETTELANQKTLRELVSDAKLSIEQDVLLTSDEKRTAKAWVLRVLQDTSTEEFDRRAALADFILSGQRSSEFA